MTPSSEPEAVSAAAAAAGASFTFVTASVSVRLMMSPPASWARTVNCCVDDAS